MTNPSQPPRHRKIFPPAQSAGNAESRSLDLNVHTLNQAISWSSDGQSSMGSQALRDLRRCSEQVLLSLDSGDAVLRFFEDEETRRAIARLSQAERLSCFVGAGASKEVGLPTWAELIARLADKATEHLPLDLKSGVIGFINDSGPLSAAERIERMLNDADMVAEIRRAIYQDDAPDSVVPGPMSVALAELKAGCPGIRLVTTNYDQLLIRALRDRSYDASSYCLSTTKENAVIHLHGVVGFEEPADGENEIVLTEHQFLAPKAGGWRKDEIGKALGEGPCLFVGASLTDLNLLTPLHQQGQIHEHVVVFVRDPTVTREEQLVREKIDRERWKVLNVQVLFADNFADVAQFVDELRRYRLDPDACVDLPSRLRGWSNDNLLPLLPTDPQTFREMQDAMSADLAALLAALQQDHDLEDEVMQLGLFASSIDDQGNEGAVVLATSDRIMLDPRSNEKLPMVRNSSWAGVKAMCSSVPVMEPKDHYASRWKFMMAVPVRLGKPYDLTVGSVVLSTTASDSKLRHIGTPGNLLTADYVALIDALQAAGERMLFSDPDA